MTPREVIFQMNLAFLKLKLFDLLSSECYNLSWYSTFVNNKSWKTVCNIYSNFEYFKMSLNKTNQKWESCFLFISYSEPYSNFFTSYSESFSTSFNTCFPRIQACFYNFRQIWGCLRMPEHSQLKICLLFIFILTPKRFRNLFCSH